MKVSMAFGVEGVSLLVCPNEPDTPCWKDKEAYWVKGFRTACEAYAYAVNELGVDPLPDTPEKYKRKIAEGDCPPPRPVQKRLL